MTNKKTTEFYSPLGDTVENPDIDWLKHFVLLEDCNYWNSGAGQGWIQYLAGNGSNSEMFLTFKDPLGFFLQFQDFDRVYYVSRLSSKESLVSVNVCGDPLYLPTGLFISRQVTAQIVEFFCKFGQRSPLIDWVESSEVDWAALENKK